MATQAVRILFVSLAFLVGAGAARAADIIEEWARTTSAPVPTLTPVTVDPKTTALLMLDFMNQNCGKRMRCVATIPAVKNLLASARAAKATVIYSVIANTTKADVMMDVAPLADEPSVQSGPDKFLRTDLEKMLAERGITTIIVVGTAANGAVLFTAASAAFRGMKVIVPVDGMSAQDPYAELTTAWTFTNAPQLSQRAVLTRSSMIRF